MGQNERSPRVRAVEWLRGISCIVLGDTVFVARQRTKKATQMLAQHAWRLSRTAP